MGAGIDSRARETVRPEVVAAASMEIALLTGCQDRPYAFGLAMALLSKGVALDIIGSDDEDSPEFHRTDRARFLKLRKAPRRSSSRAGKLAALFLYYGRLIRYIAGAKPKILHILWNNRFEYFDRTLLMLYYRAMGKRIAITAHNVNQARRDSKDSRLNRLTLRIQYHLADHIFVHTQKMKEELLSDFGLRDCNVTVIRHPINNAFPDTSLTPGEARRRLGLGGEERAVLFFGRIRPYKGLEDLLTAFGRLVHARPSVYRLIIAGEPKKGSEDYVRLINDQIQREVGADRVIAQMRFIPDEETELYLKAADVMVLPYKDIFQSGVLFLGYTYGLPVVATDVGSFREEIIEGKTGFLCRPNDPGALADAIEMYFSSDLYRDLPAQREAIREHARLNHSWAAVADLTARAYAKSLEGLAE